MIDPALGWGPDGDPRTESAIREGTTLAARETGEKRPLPTTPEVGLLEKKADWIERRLKGKTVALDWRFAGSSNTHVGVCEGVVTYSKGMSIMLTLGVREVTNRPVIGYTKTGGAGRQRYTTPEYGEPVVTTKTVPLYVPLRAAVSIKAAEGV